MIPCKECLKYPLCRNRQAVNCSAMYYYAVYHWENKKTFKNKLKRNFPNIWYLHLDNGKFPFYNQYLGP